MEEQGKLGFYLQNETDASVRTVLGHFIFVYIHPYFDGNGRIARFLMNAMLASGNYPWTVIKVEKRNVYMAALEKASCLKGFSTVPPPTAAATINITP